MKSLSRHKISSNQVSARKNCESELFVHIKIPSKQVVSRIIKNFVKSTLHSYLRTHSNFLQSLVTFVDQTPILIKMERKRLIKFNIGTMSYQKVDPNAPTPSASAKSVTSGRKPSISNASSKSAFPEIDAYVQNLVKKENENGYIRKVDTSPCGWYLTYEFSHYKFCQNIGRQHRSNNVKIFVNLKSNKVGQMCHDPDCKDFR